MQTASSTLEKFGSTSKNESQKTETKFSGRVCALNVQALSLIPSTKKCKVKHTDYPAIALLSTSMNS